MGEKSKGKGSCKTEISHLPEDIIICIFLKLPVQTVLVLRCVCKFLTTLTSTSYFIDYHLHSAERCCMIIPYKIPMQSSLFVTELFEHKYETASIYLRKFITRMDVLDTCNGLVLFGDKWFAGELYVANPATRDKVKLPARTDSGVDQDRDFSIVYKSSTREYKVIHCFGGEFWSECEILTLGGETWEPVNISDSLREAYRHLENGITIKDVAHWLSRGLEIISFDMTAQKFLKIKTPSCFHELYAEGKLLEIDGCLSFVGHPSDSGRHSAMEIWSLKDLSKGEWVKIQAFNIESRVCMVGTSENGRMIIFKQIDWRRRLGYRYTGYDTQLNQTRDFCLPKGISIDSFNSALPHYESLVSPRYKSLRLCIQHAGKARSLRWIKKLYSIKKICSTVKRKTAQLTDLKKTVTSTK